MQNTKRKYILVCFSVTALFLMIFLLLSSGTFRPNRFLVPERYCKGVDLSHYQGDVDMAVLAGQGIDFLYIKATEGRKYVDDHYKENHKNAENAGLLVGAYHFFSFESDGKTQAQHFIQTIGNQNGNLVPAVDVEYYGNKRKHKPNVEDVKKSLQKCLDTLEKQYRRKPVIYTTLSFYGRYIKGNFKEYPLWIRNVYFPAGVSVGGSWTFWQYDDKAVLDGYEGTEKYIDVNVFHGNKEALKEKMVIKRKYAYSFETCSRNVL